MRLLIAALAVSLVVATTAAVFAIWPVVTDAPWEPDEVVIPTPVIVDRTDEGRCEAALSLREAIASQFGGVNPDVVALSFQLSQAESEIDQFC